MRKGFLIMLAVVLVAAMAAPAMADLNLNGFVRIKPMISNTKGNPVGSYIAPTAGTRNDGADASDTTRAFVDQRGRFKFTVGDENVKAVAFFESDFIYGNTAYDIGRNQGGAIMGDTVQLETKNVYIWFKVPNTTIDVTAGLQGYADPYQGAIIGPATDFAGFIGNMKFDPVALKIGWAKFYEGNTGKADDTDLWFLQAQFSPTKEAMLGLNFHFINSGGASLNKNLSFDFNTPILPGNANATTFWTPNEFLNHLGAGKVTTRVYTPGVNFAVNIGPAALSGFAIYQFGDAQSAGPGNGTTTFDKIKISGYAADLRADLNLGPGKLFVEGVYGSGDSNRDDDKYKGVLNGHNLANGASGITRTDMYLLLQNADDITVNSALAYDIGNGGAGMLHLAAGYTQKFMDKLTGKLGVGWVQSAKKRRHDGTDLAPFVTGATGAAGTDTMGRLNFENEKSMGTEVNIFINYNIAKGLDFGVVGAYAWLGDAYNLRSGITTAGAIKDPDNLYDVHARLNYAF